MIDALKPGYSSPKQGTEIVSTDTCREIDINIAQSSKPNENQETKQTEVDQNREGPH